MNEAQVNLLWGAELITLKERLTHKSIAMTLRYAQLSAGHRQKAVGVLDIV